MNIEKDVILEILRDACRAPSGDNTQPWRFEVRGNIIRILNISENDTSLFNWNQISNHIALGGAVENLCVSAQGKGLETTVSLFPEKENLLLVACVELSIGTGISDELAPYVSTRATNRKKYYRKKIESEKLSEIENLANNSPERIVLLSGKEKTAELARIVSAGEKLALEDKSIHDFLFSHVTWNQKEDSQKHGFLIDTFEFSPPQKTVFRLLSNWKLLKLLLPIGISDFIARDMQKVHATAPTFGAILLPGSRPEDYVHGGMLMERLWLVTTKLELSLQPATTVGIIGTHVVTGEPVSLSSVHQGLLRKEYENLSREFGAKESERFCFVFRIGYADAPSAMTTRAEPRVTFED